MIDMVEKNAVKARNGFHSGINSLLRHTREKTLVAALIAGGILGPAPLFGATQAKPNVSANATIDPVEVGIHSMQDGVKVFFINVTEVAAIAVGVFGANELMKLKTGLRNSGYESKNRHSLERSHYHLRG